MTDLDTLAREFTTCLTIKLKETTIKQEIEKTGELQRRVGAATRAIRDAFAAHPDGAVQNAAWEKYIKEVYPGNSNAVGEQAVTGGRG